MGQLARQERRDGAAEAPRPAAEGLFVWLGALVRAHGRRFAEEEKLRSALGKGQVRLEHRSVAKLMY